MGRNISTGVYTYPDGTPGNPNQTIFSARYNTFLNDLANTLNTVLPINMGGTGGNTAVAARDSLDVEVAGQTVTNYDTHAWENGSFSSDSGATGAPLAGRYFTGTCQKLTSNPTNYITLYARTSDGTTPDVTYSRRMIAGIWQPWVQTGQASTGFGSSYFGNDVADMSFGLTGTSPDSAFFVNSESDATGNTIFSVKRSGPITIMSPNSVLSINSNIAGTDNDIYLSNFSVPRWLLRSAGASGDFLISRFDGAGALVDIPLSINWGDGRVSVSEPVSAAHVATKNYVDTTTMSSAGDTMTGALFLNTDTVSVPLTLNATNGTAVIALNNLTGPPHAAAIIASSAAQSRWALYLGDGTTEGGGNTGNNFKLSRFADDGSLLSDNLNIDRANGRVTITGAGFKLSNIVQHDASDSNPRYVFYNADFVAALGEVQCDGATSQMRFINWAAGGREIIFQANGSVQVGIGINTRAGMSGVLGGNSFNINWVSTNADLWIDTFNVGTIAFTSDYRTKKDIADLDTTWEAVKALRPISYTQADHGELFKADDVERWGFIAHELQETLIESAATGVKDDPVNIQSPNPWVVIAALTKALQEAMARIEALEERQ